MIAGSELVPVISSPPATLPRKVCVPPSKVTNSTSILFSPKKPISLATYGGICTTLGGVTGTPKTTFRLVCASTGVSQSQSPTSDRTNTFFIRASLSLLRFLKISPRGDPPLHPFREPHQPYHYYHNYHDGNKELVGFKGVGITDNHVAQTGDRGIKLGDDHPDQAAPNRQPHADHDKRYS